MDLEWNALELEWNVMELVLLRDGGKSQDNHEDDAKQQCQLEVEPDVNHCDQQLSNKGHIILKHFSKIAVRQSFSKMKMVHNKVTFSIFLEKN